MKYKPDQIHASSSGFSGDSRDLMIIELRHELAACRRKNEELRFVLLVVEWVKIIGRVADVCPWCNANELTGHKPDCPRQKALED